MSRNDGRDNPWLRTSHASRRRRPATLGDQVEVPVSATVRLWADAGDWTITPPEDARRLRSWTEPVWPHLGGTDLDWSTAGWWWLGVHGGAGVSTLAALIPGGADAQRLWPDPAFGGPGALILVTRASVLGLTQARDAARQWAARDVPSGLLLAGCVVVADSAARLERAQQEGLRLLEGVVPRLWLAPWQDELRLSQVFGSGVLHPDLGRLASDLRAIRPDLLQGGNA